MMDELIDELEHEARQRSESLEAAGKLPAGFTEHHYPLTAREHAELQRLKAAMEIADGPDTFLAIYHGGKIPRAWYRRRLRELLQRR